MYAAWCVNKTINYLTVSLVVIAIRQSIFCVHKIGLHGFKNNLYKLYFHENLNTTLLPGKWSEFSLFLDSMLCQALNTYARQCWPEMSKQIWNQQWLT